MLNIIPLLTSPLTEFQRVFLSVSPSNPVRQNGFTVTQFCYCLFSSPFYLTFCQSLSHFEQEVIIDIVFLGNTGNRGSLGCKTSLTI